jgi:hypothetical protein
MDFSGVKATVVRLKLVVLHLFSFLFEFAIRHIACSSHMVGLVSHMQWKIRFPQPELTSRATWFETYDL